MRLLWKAGVPMRFNISTGANWTPPPAFGLAEIAGGFRVNSVTAPPSTPTLGTIAGGFSVA